MQGHFTEFHIRFPLYAYFIFCVCAARCIDHNMTVLAVVKDYGRMGQKYLLTGYLSHIVLSERGGN